MAQLRLKDYLVIAGGILLIALSLSIAHVNPVDSAGSAPVTVVNTPLPVQGTVSITGTPTVNVGNFPPSIALKPSQLVTIINGVASPVNNCPSGRGNQMDTLSNPDATVSPFSVPPGKVLVITAANLSSPVGTSDHRILLEIDRASGPSDNLIATQVVLSNDAGDSAAAFTFPSGVVVKSGVSVCVSAFDAGSLTFLNIFATLQGYLTADQ